jgi:hypothetical protein
LDRGTPGTSLLLVAGDQVEFPPGRVRFDGTTASIDVTSLGNLTQGQLKFQLVGSDDDTGTEVEIRNIASVADPEGAAGPQFPLDGTLAVIGGPLDLGTLSPASDAEVLVGNVRVNSPYTAEKSFAQQRTGHWPRRGHRVSRPAGRRSAARCLVRRTSTCARRFPRAVWDLANRPSRCKSRSITPATSGSRCD